MGEKSFDEKYAEYYDLFNQGKNYEEESSFLKEVFKKYSQFEIKSILNLGCGTGAHEIALAKRGYNITGLDLSKDMIKIAISKNIPNTNFAVGDMANFYLNKNFDACICMFAAFGYLINNIQIKSSLDCIKKHLKSGSLFIMDVWNGLGVIRELPSSRIKTAEVSNLKITRTSHPKLDAFNHKCDVKFDVKVHQGNLLIDSYQELHKVRFFFPQEIKKYLEDAGFEVLEICKTWKIGTLIDEKDWNMVIIARVK